MGASFDELTFNAMGLQIQAELADVGKLGLGGATCGPLRFLNTA